LETEADETTKQLQEFARDLNERQYLSVANSCQARLALLRGDTAQALEWSRSLSEAATPSTLFLWLEAPAMTRARVLIASGSERQLQAARESVEAIRAVSKSCRFTCQTIEAAVLLSVALDMQGCGEGAFVCLDDALKLAEPRGWVRPFVELGQPMANLLLRAPLEDVSVNFVDRLLEAFGEFPPRTQPKSPSSKTTIPPVEPSARPEADAKLGIQPPVDALTSRELETLQLLAERLYDKEIAKTLSISVWTVRTHVKHIFEKLHVSNRRQAVLKADELGLLK
jgi:LuxR family maltose regulon positive regulatory protein